MKKYLILVLVLALLAVAAWFYTSQKQEKQEVLPEMVSAEIINETEASVEENAIETEGMIDEDIEEINPDETEDEGETIVSE